MIYLDYAATTPLDPEVNNYMYKIGADIFANPSSLHSAGRHSKVLLEKSRKTIADSISAGRDEIVFTSGGTEANNQAIIGSALALRGRGKHLITSQIEHPSVLRAFQYLEQQGFRVSYLKVNEQGMPDLRELSGMLTDKTTLVSMMMVNNETGSILPIQEIVRLLRPRHILFHCDAVQAYGKINVNVDDLSVNLLSLSSHKIYGPKGCGALYIRKGIIPERLLHGGAQEANQRPGTENLIAIAGFSKAAESIPTLQKKTKNIGLLRDLFEQRLTEKIPGLLINGRGSDRVYSHSNVYFPDHSGMSLMINLDRMGIAVSTGSACSSGSSNPSHVLRAMGLSEKRIKNSVRFSLGHQTTKADILKTTAALITITAVQR